MSNDTLPDVIQADQDDVTGDVATKDSSVVENTLVSAVDPDIGPTSPRSGVGIVGANTLRALGKASRPLVPPPPRPAVKASPVASNQPLVKALGKVPVPSVRSETTSKPESPKTETTTAKPVPSTRPVQATRSVPMPRNEPSSPPSEKTRVFRPNLTDPNVRRSLAPTAPPPVRLAVAGRGESKHGERLEKQTEAVDLPKQPRVPADLAAASQRGSAGSQATELSVVEEDETRTYSHETIDKLLHGEHPTVRPHTNTAADDVTRVGELPIEALVAAQQAPSAKKGIGHDDVTRVYDLPLGPAAAPSSETTAPGNRKSAFNIQAEPLVIIQPEPPKAHWGRWVFLGLVVALAAAGWTYRAPISKQTQRLQTSFIRGLGARKATNTKVQSPAATLVSVSISVSPVDARLLLDGVAVTNPYSVQQPSDKLAHNLVAEAPGYLPLRRTVQFERDLTVVLALAPEPQAPAPVATTAPAAVADAPATPATRAVPASAWRRKARAAAAPEGESTESPSAPSPAPAANCNPPYTVDGEGIKTYKPECL